MISRASAVAAIVGARRFQPIVRPTYRKRKTMRAFAYSSIGYDLDRSGIAEALLFGHSMIYRAISPGVYDFAAGPDLDVMKSSVDQFVRPDQFVVVNIEHTDNMLDLRRYTLPEVDAYMGEFTAVLRFLRGYVPTQRIGVYAVPLIDYWPAVNYRRTAGLLDKSKTAEDFHDAWREYQLANNYLSEIYELTGSLLPQCYGQYYQDGVDFEDDWFAQEWKTYCSSNADEAMRLGGPTVLNLMREWNANGTAGDYRPLEEPYIRMQFEHAIALAEQRRCEAVALFSMYSGDQTGSAGERAWSNDDLWWQLVREYFVA